MRSGVGRDAWAVRHALYPDAVARTALIAGPLNALSAGGHHWFFVDIPFAVDTGLRHGLEIALRHADGRPAAERLLDRMLVTAQAAALIEASAAAPAAQSLQPALFPAGLVSTAYVEALAHGSVRATGLIAAGGGASSLPDAVVAAELFGGYRGFFPQRRMRLVAQLRHAAWLEAAAGLLAAAGAGPAVAPSLSADGPERPVVPAALRRALTDAARRAASRLSGMGGSADAAAVRADLVARLLHIQAMRLWGPGRQEALRAEAALVRGFRLTDQG